MSDETGPGWFAGRLGAVVEKVDEGTAHLGSEATEDHLNPAGTVHAGVLATLVDTAMGTAVRSTTGGRRRAGDQPAHRHLPAARKPGRLEVTARVRTRGEHLTVCEADVERDGRSLVYAVATFALLHD